MAIVGALFFLLLMFSPSASNTTQSIDLAGRLGAGLIFAALGVFLMGWFSTLVRAVGTRHIRWFIVLMVFPPSALFYLYMNRNAL